MKTGLCIYVSAGIQILKEQEFNRSLRDALEKYGYRVILPQEECGVFDDNGNLDRPATRKLCIEKMSSADVVIADLDGQDADSGAVYEMTRMETANLYTKFKTPIIGFSTKCPDSYLSNLSRLSGGHDHLNLMLDGPEEKSEKSIRIWMPAHETTTEMLAEVLHHKIQLFF